MTNKNLQKRSGKRKFVSYRETLLYYLQTRDLEFHPIFSTNRLGQLFIIDAYMRMIDNRMDVVRQYFTSTFNRRTTAFVEDANKVL